MAALPGSEAARRAAAAVESQATSEASGRCRRSQRWHCASLRMGVHHLHGIGGRFHGQKRVFDARHALGLDVDLIFHEQVETLAYGALQDVFERDHAEGALAPVHGGEGFPKVLAGPVVHEMPEQIHGGEIGIRALGTEIGHGNGPLEAAGRGEDFVPDGPKVLLGQGAGIFAGEVVQHLPFALRTENRAGRVRLHLAHFEAQGRTAVEQGQQFAVDGVDAAAQILKSFRGRCGGPVGGGVVGCFGHGYISRMFS